MSTLELAPGEVAHIGRDGETLELMEWARRFTDKDYSIVAHTELIAHGIIVRTEWVGVADTVEVGVMYETYAEGPDNQRLRVWHSHWPCTEDEAKAAHEQAVAMVRELATKR